MTILTILAIIGLLFLFWVHLNTSFWIRGGRYNTFPKPEAVISLIQTIILAVYFIYSQDYMNKV